MRVVGVELFVLEAKNRHSVAERMPTGCGGACGW